MTPTGIENFAKKLETSIAEATSQIDVPVVIMGPALNQVKPPPAAILRTELLARCKGIGTSVYPEHKMLIKIAKKHLGAGHDLATYEHFIAMESELVVIIPSSPGSLCELGYFSMIEELRPKMIIFLDRAHTSSKSYIIDGPVLAARKGRAKVKHIDYKNIDSAWRIVKREIEKIRATRAISMITSK